MPTPVEVLRDPPVDAGGAIRNRSRVRPFEPSEGASRGPSFPPAASPRITESGEPDTIAAHRIVALRDAVWWSGLAVGALAVSGALAIVLVVQRILALATVPLGDPELARRSLVVHVNLATGVWLFAFIVGLTCLASRARIYSARIGLALDDSLESRNAP